MKFMMYRTTYTTANMRKSQSEKKNPEGFAGVSTGVKTRQKATQNIKVYGRFTKQEYACNLKIK